ncbi:MAG: hypothetical protein K2P53_04745 [Rickettsiales bacterium]|nr:hypothetical protein [Rickettsiales bacterium]
MLLIGLYQILPDIPRPPLPYAYDVSKLSPLLSKHINILGKYSFVLPESVRDGKLRELDNENFP